MTTKKMHVDFSVCYRYIYKYFIYFKKKFSLNSRDAAHKWSCVLQCCHEKRYPEHFIPMKDDDFPLCQCDRTYWVQVYDQDHDHDGALFHGAYVMHHSRWYCHLGWMLIVLLNHNDYKIFTLFTQTCVKGTKLGHDVLNYITVIQLIFLPWYIHAYCFEIIRQVALLHVKTRNFLEFKVFSY